MFCLRSWLPVLFIPTDASPAFVFLFLLCTYFITRPCFYCSVLLLILFLTSCNWSDRCYMNVGANWFESGLDRSLSSITATGDINATATAVVADMLNTTAGALATAATQQLAQARAEWTGLGVEWLRSLLGRREWRVDCLDLYIRL